MQKRRMRLAFKTFPRIARLRLNAFRGIEQRLMPLTRPAVGTISMFWNGGSQRIRSQMRHLA
jgi:hypothetical protein